MPTAISTAAAMAEWRAGLGLGGRAERASTTGTRATVRPGHQAATVAPRTARRTAIAISPHGRLSRSMRWSTADSSVGAKTTQSARPATVPMIAAIAPTSGAVRHQHETEVLLRGADGGEHAELAEPSLSDDCEACGGNQRGQEQEDGGDGEHRERVGGLDLAADPSPVRPERPFSLQRVCEGAELLVARVDQNRDVLRRPADAGETRANSSLSSRGFSTMPTTVRRRPSSASVAPSSTLQELGHTVGDGDLAGPAG